MHLYFQMNSGIYQEMHSLIPRTFWESLGGPVEGPSQTAELTMKKERFQIVQSKLHIQATEEQGEFLVLSKITYEHF